MTIYPRLALFIVLLLSFSSCVIVHHGEKGSEATAAANDGAFDSEGFVVKNWDNQILPELTKNAVDLTTLLNTLAADPEVARARYGHRQEETAPYAFVVKGNTKILSADLESSASTVTLAATAPVEGAEVVLQIGPVIRTSSVRDALSFIHFGDFTNQVDFANLSRALNTRVRDTVVNSLQRETLVGKTLSFTGTFLEDPSGRLLITPVLLEVKK